VIFGGNSGGPLVNEEGLIIGINEVGIGSLGGAIPGNLAKDVAAQLIAKGSVSRGWIGLEVQELLRGERKEHGVLVASVFADSPAAKAGIKQGDFLHSLNGTTIQDCRSPEDLPVFNAMVLGAAPGSRIRLSGEHAGQPTQWEVEVLPRSLIQNFEAEFNTWGMTARSVSSMGAIELKRADTHGVQVHSTRSGGPAASAKPSLEDNDIITHLDGREILNLDEFREFNRSLPASKSPQSVLVAFERGVAHAKYLTVVNVGPEPDGQTPLTADRGWLGAEVQVLGSELAKALKLPGSTGVRLTRVHADSPAAKAGLQVGDVLTKIDGQAIPVRRPEDVKVFSESLADRGPDAAVKFRVVREGAETEMSVNLAASPSDEDDVPKYKDMDFEFSVRDLTDAVKDQLNIPRTVKAARVTDVIPNGWASLAGIVKGDLILSIDGEGIEGAKSLEKKLTAIKAAKKAQTVFFIQRGVRNQFIQLEPSWSSHS
jgi:serine protease Do